MSRDERAHRDSVDRSPAHECRRTVVRFLRDTDDGIASLDDLVDHVIEQATDSPAPDRETVTYELCHVHLPTLAARGVIDFDERTETARYTGHPETERELDAQ